MKIKSGQRCSQKTCLNSRGGVINGDQVWTGVWSIEIKTRALDVASKYQNRAEV